MSASQETTAGSRLAWGLIGVPVMCIVVLMFGASVTERSITDFTVNVFGKAVVEQPLWLIPISVMVVAAIIILVFDDIFARWFKLSRSAIDIWVDSLKSPEDQARLIAQQRQQLP